MGKSQVTYLTILSVVLLVAALFVLLYPRFSHNEEVTPDRVSTIIPVKHQYRNGTHTYVGEIQTPTPCHSVSGEATVRESYPEQVTIRLETKNTAEMCAQVIDNKKFRVSFTASEQAVVKPLLNGIPILFRVEEVSSDINLQTDIL